MPDNFAKSISSLQLLKEQSAVKVVRADTVYMWRCRRCCSFRPDNLVTPHSQGTGGEMIEEDKDGGNKGDIGT